MKRSNQILLKATTPYVVPYVVRKQVRYPRELKIKFDC